MTISAADLAMMNMKIAAVWTVGISILLLAVGGVLGSVQIGDTREQVVEENGQPVATMKFGAFETLDLRDGTRVNLQDGVVTEVGNRRYASRPGQTNAAAGVARTPAAARQAGRPDTPRKSVALTERASIHPEQGEARTRERPPSAGGNVSLPGSSSGPEELPAGALDSSTKAKRMTSFIATNFNPVLSLLHPGQGKAATTNWAQASKVLGDLAALSPQIHERIRGLGQMVVALVLGSYLLSCYFFKRICEKAGQAPGILVWLPVIQFVPLFRVAQMSPVMLILLLVPLVNVVIFLILWARICTALAKNPWWAATLLIPIVNLGLIPYLALCGVPARLAGRREQPRSP